MTAEVQQQIQKFLYNLSQEDYATATKNLKEIVEKKQQDRFDAEYTKIKSDKK